jgi:hypothetical protein
MPPELAARYTMNGLVEVEEGYCNDTRAARKAKVFKRRRIRSDFRKLRNGESRYYGETDDWLREALRDYPVTGLRVVNMGATNPWYESFLLYHGAAGVTTVEYNRIVCRHRKIRPITPAELAAEARRYDAGTSISSFEHDGLGRYGDPLDPDADLAAMARMRTTLRPGGLLYLSVPIGRDKVVWNAHRIYGRHRFERLVEGWKLLGAYGGFEPGRLDRDTGAAADYQPVFVLENPSG